MGFDYAQNLIRRSRLIVPANERKYVEKAHLRNADAVVLDLEDSAPVSEKVATRTVLKEAIPLAGRCGSDVLVRVNHTNELLRGDVEASVWPGLDGIFSPKVETGAQVRALDQLLTKTKKGKGPESGDQRLILRIQCSMVSRAVASNPLDTGNLSFYTDFEKRIII